MLTRLTDSSRWLLWEQEAHPASKAPSLHAGRQEAQMPAVLTCGAVW